MREVAEHVTAVHGSEKNELGDLLVPLTFVGCTVDSTAQLPPPQLSLSIS